MQKLSWLLLLLLPPVSLICTSCLKDNLSKKQELHLALAADPTQFDTRKIKDMSSSALAGMFSEGLVRYNENNQLSPGLAKKYEVSQDGLTYTFTLRKNLTWSDGKPLTAHDFEYSWKKILHPHFSSEHTYIFYAIENAKDVKEGKLPPEKLGCKALDDRHFEVVLERPLIYFPSLCSFYAFHPVQKDIDETNPRWASQIGNSFPSCGPFSPVNRAHKSELHLKKNPNYWDAKSVSIEAMHFSIIPDENTVLKLFESGAIDFMGCSEFCSIPIDLIPQYRAKGELHSKGVARSIGYKLNTTLPLLRNQKVRQALSLAIDRAGIVESVAQGTFTPATSFLPPALELSSNLISPVALQEKAQVLFYQGMQEEGITWCELPKLRLSYNDNEISKRIAQALQQQWKDHLGLEVGLECLEWKTYLTKLHKLDYEIGQFGWAADYLEPINYLEVFQYADPIRGSNNETGWENSNYCSLLNEAQQASNQQEYQQKLTEAEQLLVEACPVLALFHCNINWLQSDRLQNVKTNDLGRVDFKWAKLETPSKDQR